MLSDMEAHEELLSWAEHHGIELTGVRPDRIPGRGIGIIATKKLKADETLLRVPTGALRTVLTIPEAITKELPQSMSVHGLLAADLAIDDSGQYDEWNAVLPTPEDVESMPFLWAPELQALLPVRAADLLRKQEAKFARDWEAVATSPLPTRHSDKLTKETYRYAWLLANTRTFYHVCERTKRLPREDRMVLQPVADLFNHADTGCAVHFGDDDFTICADREYEAGDELFIRYGNHSNDFLLTEYGFVLATNRYDEVCIDDAVLPRLSKDQRDLLEQRDFLGNYMVDSETVCYRTETALRLVCSPVAAWEAHVSGVDYNGTRGAEQRTQARVDKLLLDVLRKHQAHLRHTRIAPLEDPEEFAGVGTAGQRALLLERWEQIDRLIGAAVERQEGKLKR